MNAVHNTLNIRIWETPQQAPHYLASHYKPIRIEQVNIVRKGTEDGLSTVDFELRDERGQKYMALVTGRLMNTLAALIGEKGL